MRPRRASGGVVGFPSGAQSTASKVAEVREHSALGAVELDMVINVGMLRSGRDRYVEDDIRAVVEAAQGTPGQGDPRSALSDRRADRARQPARRARRRGVRQDRHRLGSDRRDTPQRALIKSAVGDAARVKAAGGVRDLPTVVEMIRLGVTPFRRRLEFGPHDSRRMRRACRTESRSDMER